MLKMQQTMKSFAIASALAAVVVGSVQAADTARYQVRFDATWTADSHPMDYPASAHLSGLVGATHSNSYQVFRDGVIATPGLKALSEMGSHSPLNNEINAAIKAGTAGALFESAPLFNFPGSISAKFTAEAAHPFVSAVAMIAPSPDWFTGVSKVSLRKDGRWVNQVTHTLFAMDAGTDDGTTYTAANAGSMPRQSVRLNAMPHFKGKKGLKQVGSVTFTRLNKTAGK